MTEYRIYANDGANGPVMYGSPVATATASPWAAPPVAPGTDTTWAVRAYDPATGHEDPNTDQRARLVTDAAGNDVTGRPNRCSGVSAVPRGLGGAVVSWSYSPPGQGGPPRGFRVWASTGAIDFTQPPTATAPYLGGATGTATLSGLTPGATYNLAVRAYNAVADDGNSSATASITLPASGPSPVSSLAAVAS